ncbi:MAG: RHS repeat-associated core domain-containing protein [Vulcanimicrobiota bacterium]
MRQRHYDPTLARFLSRDRVANLNRYVYALDNPIGRVDPGGLDPVTTAAGVGRALAQGLAPLRPALKAGKDTFVATPGPPQVRLGAAIFASLIVLSLETMASAPPPSGSVSPDPMTATVTCSQSP